MAEDLFSKLRRDRAISCNGVPSGVLVPVSRPMLVRGNGGQRVYAIAKQVAQESGRMAPANYRVVFHSIPPP
jgi:hypothetical protein